MESELVAGFFTEHGSLVFVFFFLGEYNSIVLMSTLSAIFFLGGYHMPELIVNESVINLQSIVLGLKACVFCLLFVWFRATLPRLRYDQLMQFCWVGMLPIAIAFVALVPSILIAFDITPPSSLIYRRRTDETRNTLTESERQMSLSVCRGELTVPLPLPLNTLSG
jgi:NADH-ubiquinone oxidoreductase chain 1